MKNVVVILVLTLLLAGCKEEENVIQYSEGGETVFYFTSSVEGTGEPENTIVKFKGHTSDFTKVPNLIVDQIEVLYWYPNSSSYPTSYPLISHEVEIPYKRSLPFTIGKNNLSTEGNLILPTKIENFRCNGTQITSNNYLMPDTIQKSFILKFEWDCEDSDSFFVSIMGSNNIYFYTSQKIYENLTLVPGSYRISISSIKGSESKNSTYFQGRYGRGYFYGTWTFQYEILVTN